MPRFVDQSRISAELLALRGQRELFVLTVNKRMTIWGIYPIYQPRDVARHLNVDAYQDILPSWDGFELLRRTDNNVYGRSLIIPMNSVVKIIRSREEAIKVAHDMRKLMKSKMTPADRLKIELGMAILVEKNYES